MKNVSSLKSSVNEAAKTPGGISKSLLTPCRRLGLSRNWKKSGPSPFISPLSGSIAGTPEVNTEKKTSRKRKERVVSDEIEQNEDGTPKTPTSKDDVQEDKDTEEVGVPSCKGADLSSTPTRHFDVPRKKKSKTLLTALTRSSIGLTKTLETDNTTMSSNKEVESSTIAVVKQKSKSKSKNLTSPKAAPKTSNLETKSTSEAEFKENVNVSQILDKPDEKPSNVISHKPRSPNELTKECIVVLQKKMFKTDTKDGNKIKEKVTSLNLLNSDSDDEPLSKINKQEIEKDKNTEVHNLIQTIVSESNSSKCGKVDIQNKKDVSKKEKVITIEDDDDFTETKKTKVKKLEDKATSIGGLKKKTLHNSKSKLNKPTARTTTTDFDDDEDFDFDNKKTILIRKTYEKVIKPQKAKSTGSITQKDIDELKARIEVKKKLLIARAITPDTEELRVLIKKWQRGCQDALMELMDLMKTKFPDKQNTDYSEMLSLLKIPSNLVGYDSENDCFVTPEDSNIVLSSLDV